MYLWLVRVKAYKTEWQSFIPINPRLLTLEIGMRNL